MKYLVSLVALTVPSLALAMGEVPQVGKPANFEAISRAELQAVQARQTCVLRTYNGLSYADRQVRYNDYNTANVNRHAAETAVKLGNRAAFNMHRDAVAKVAIGFGC